MNDYIKISDPVSGKVCRLKPDDYSSEMLKPVERKEVMLDGTIKLIQPSKQDYEFTLIFSKILRPEYEMLYELWSKRGRIYDFEDDFENKIKVIISSLRQPAGPQGLYTVHLSFIYKR